MFLFSLHAGQCYLFHIYLVNYCHVQLLFCTRMQLARLKKSLPSWSLYSDILSQTEMHIVKIHMTGLICCSSFPRKAKQNQLSYRLEPPEARCGHGKNIFESLSSGSSCATQVWQAAMRWVCQLVARHQCRLNQLAGSRTRGWIRCVCPRIPTAVQTRSSVVLGKHAQKGTKNQPLENLGKAQLSWNVERDAGEVKNHCQQENRCKSDMALPPPTAHLASLALIPTFESNWIPTDVP